MKGLLNEVLYFGSKIGLNLTHFFSRRQRSTIPKQLVSMFNFERTLNYKKNLCSGPQIAFPTIHSRRYFHFHIYFWYRDENFGDLLNVLCSPSRMKLKC